MQGGEKVERVLWNYVPNVKNVEKYRALYGDLMSVRGQDYGAHTVNGVSDPVSEVVHRKIELGKKIASAEREIQAVERLKDSLPLEELNTYHMCSILRKRYMEHKSADIVMRELGNNEGDILPAEERADRTCRGVCIMAIVVAVSDAY